MKRFFIIAICLILSAFPVNAIDQNTYFTVDPNTTYKCIYINLPQDLGISNPKNTLTAIVRSENPWVDTTYYKLTVNPDVITKNPICFSYKGKNEGDYSFYEIIIYSPELNVSKTFNGGICISKYKDVETGQKADNKTNICNLLSNNNDIFSAQFRNEYIFAKPYDTITQSFYITSYAYLTIDVDVSSDLDVYPKKQTVVTSPSSPTKNIDFRIKTSSPGTHYVSVDAKVKNCNISICERKETLFIEVGDVVKSGYEVSVVPKSINVESPQKVDFRVIILNHDTKKRFYIEAESDPYANIEPKSMNLDVYADEVSESVFSVTPLSENEVYTINFVINNENILTSYLSVGEMVRDAKRDADEILNSAVDESVKKDVLSATNNWLKKHSNVSYGSDLKEYEDLKDVFENAKKAAGKNVTTPQYDQKQESDKGANWLVYVIPTIIFIGIIIFILYKKSKTVKEIEYPTFDEYGRE